MRQLLSSSLKACWPFNSRCVVWCLIQSVFGLQFGVSFACPGMLLANRLLYSLLYSRYSRE